jgi:uncharacterized membrane protein YcaP (DUF421 family)
VQLNVFDPHALLKALTPTLPAPEIIMRGTIVFLVLYFLLRLLPRRETGGAGTADILVIVLIADAAQNAMAGSYTSVPDGLLLVGTIVFWSWSLDWASYHVPFMKRLISPASLVLIRDGRILRKNMAKELITEDELWSQLRLHGVDELSHVREARIESDGSVSVVTDDERPRVKPPERKTG